VSIVRLAVATNAQTLRGVFSISPAIFEIPHEPRPDRPRQPDDAHRYRREAPEVRHEPRVRIGRQSGVSRSS